MNPDFNSIIKNIFSVPVTINDNVIHLDKTAGSSIEVNQGQTKEIFDEKWIEAGQYQTIEKMYEFQQEWFLKLYGFGTEEGLAKYLSSTNIVLETGCGLGYKSSWLAKMAPHALVIGIDISDCIKIPIEKYKGQKNLFFLKADIANTYIKPNTIDFTICDQVIMHTEDPERTFDHLSDITAKNGEFACYVYSKKALPRELMDDYFRAQTHNISSEEMWKFSEQLTVLGKSLSELKVNIDCPDIPLLGIKGGTYDIQRFIYWNFLKCFWKEDWGFELSRATNFDWYAPSNAKRFSKSEFLKMVHENNLSEEFFHEEEACYSGRFKK